MATKGAKGLKEKEISLFLRGRRICGVLRIDGSVAPEPTRKDHMKTMNSVLIGAALTVAFTLGIQAQGQPSSSDDNRLTASPRLRQTLTELRPVASPVAKPVALEQPVSTLPDNLAASPRTRQNLDFQPQTVIVSKVVAPVPQAAAASSIAASPRLQEQWNQQPASFQIAPLK